MSNLSIASLILVLSGILYFIWQSSARKKGFRLTGIIIDFQSDISSMTGGTITTRESPIVEYKDENGNMKSSQINDSMYVGKHKLGDELSLVKYENKLYLIKNFRTKSLIVIGLGLILFFISII